MHLCSYLIALLKPYVLYTGNTMRKKEGVREFEKRFLLAIMLYKRERK